MNRYLLESLPSKGNNKCLLRPRSSQDVDIVLVVVDIMHFSGRLWVIQAGRIRDLLACLIVCRRHCVFWLAG